MELKKYQKRVITDLREYLSHLEESKSLDQAFATYWGGRGVTVGAGGMSRYQNVLEGVPNVCFKVPTGGGKTLLACASALPILQAMPPMRHRAVVWLVPSDSILTQTLSALRDTSHPYRRQLDADFGGRVEVYSKEELLAGQNFSPAAVADQLSVMVLSYDSFRARNREGLKAYQANGALAPFATVLGAPEQPITNADPTALFQVINQLNPLVIVDESHHATTTLSREMLTNFNPSFVLDLTATPKKQANVISYVDAYELKAEHMVKLPVIAYNRQSQAEVITDAIDLQQSLEAAAEVQFRSGGRYVRPIVLFQAEPKAKEDATSFEKLREKLVAAGIPENQIAIKTAGVDELRGVDLLSDDCEIRFIITVNALKEGWDCPFAYVLASLANKSSRVDVEQILGRVLRQPHATRFAEPILNMSYVLTSSADFQGTLSNIIAGLNAAGFSKHDVRAADEEVLDLAPAPAEVPTEPLTHQDDRMPQDDAPTPGEEFLGFDTVDVADRLAAREAEAPDADPDTTSSSALTPLLERARAQGTAYEQDATQAAQRGDRPLPQEVKTAVGTSRMLPEYVEEFAGYRLPQFVTRAPGSALFGTLEGELELLHHEALAEGFTLRGRDTQLNLAANEQMYRIDVHSSGDVPRAFRMSETDQRIMRQHFSGLSIEGQRRSAAQDIFGKLRPINAVADSDLKSYVERVVGTFDAAAMAVYMARPQRVADAVRAKVKDFLDDYKAQKFADDVETHSITVDFSYGLPEAIQPLGSSTLIGRSLYEAEDRMNDDEAEFAARFSGMDNVRWWHRNIERRGFCINGPLNHYPDFLVMTTRGTLVAVEPKGGHLKNDESLRKLAMGKKWAELAGRTGQNVSYYMVFQDDVAPLDGALTVTKFFELLGRM